MGGPVQQPLDIEPTERSPLLRLTLLRDIILRPRRAYEAILTTRSWLPAYAVVVACGLFDLWLSTPALTHVLALAARHDPNSAFRGGGTAATRHNLFLNSALFEFLQPVVQWSLAAIVASLVARFRRMTPGYGVFFSLAALCSIPGALGAVVDGIAVWLRPAASYASLKALAVAAPDNLAIFASSHNDREVVFLSSFGLFDVWSTVLFAYGLIAFTKMRVTTALAIAFGIDIIVALTFAP